MAQVGASFKITGSGKIVGAINSMICAVEDEGMYGAEFAYEEGDKVLEADVENIDLEGIVGWAEIFREALKENGRSRFSFTVEGVADNDYGVFTAFRLKCTQSAILKREKEFEVVCDEEDFHARQEAVWDAEEENIKALDGIADEEVFDAEYDDGEYDAATDALADSFDEME